VCVYVCVCAAHNLKAKLFFDFVKRPKQLRTL